MKRIFFNRLLSFYRLGYVSNSDVPNLVEIEHDQVIDFLIGVIP